MTIGFIVVLVLLLSATFTMAAPAGYKVDVPYVMSTATGWWTGIAITNRSGDTISGMKLYFWTDEGNSGQFITPKLAPADPIEPIMPIWLSYSATLDDVPGYGLLVGSLPDLYDGTLPSETGSISIVNEGLETFSATIYIGNADGGFSYNVFEAEAYYSD